MWARASKEQQEVRPQACIVYPKEKAERLEAQQEQRLGNLGP